MSELDDQNEDVRSPRGTKRGGATISYDPRVTSVSQWVWNAIQTLMVLALCFVANNLYQVNLTLAGDAVTKLQMSRDIDDTKERTTALERAHDQLSGRVYILEGKTMRGVPDGKR